MNRRVFRFSRMLVGLFVLVALVPLLLSVLRLVFALHEEIVGGAAQQLQAELATIAERIHGNFQALRGNLLQVARNDDLVVATNDHFFSSLAERQFTVFMADKPFVVAMHLVSSKQDVLVSHARSPAAKRDRIPAMPSSPTDMVFVEDQGHLLLIAGVASLPGRPEESEVFPAQQALGGAIALEVALDKFLLFRLDELKRPDAHLLIMRGRDVASAMAPAQPFAEVQAFSQSRRVSPLPQMEFELVLSEDRRHKLARAKDIVVEAGLLALLFGLSGLAVGAIVARRLARPIEELARVASRYNQGDYSVQPKPSMFAEFTTLSDAFVEMVARIRTQIRELNGTIVNLHGLATEGRIVAGVVNLSRLQMQVRTSVGNLLKVSLESAQGDNSNLDIGVFFSETCFLSDRLPQGFYTVDHRGVPELESRTDIGTLQERFGVVLPVNDPRTLDVVAVVGVAIGNRDVLGRIIPTLEALITNISSAITTVRLEMAYRALRTKTQRIRTIFDSVNIGILLVDHNLRIEPEHSEHVSRVFGERGFGGWSLREFLRHKSDLGADVIHELEQRLLACMGETAYSVELNEESFPRVFFHENREGARFIEIDWIPVFDRNECVEHFMVVLHDATDFRRLKEESDSQKREMQILFQIGARTVSEYRRFMAEAKSVRQECELLLGNAAVSSSGMAHMRRIVHTLKGNAGSLGYSMVVEAIHGFEQRIKTIHDGTDLSASLLAYWRVVDKVVCEFESVFERRLAGFFGGVAPGVTVSEERVGVSDFMMRFSQNLGTLAKAVGRRTPLLSFSAEREWKVSAGFAEVLLPCLTQLARNSLAHALAGDSQGGHVRIEINRNDDCARFIYSDSGRGLDLATLALRAREVGLLPSSDDVAVAATIFSSGVTTATTSTNMAGEGVGLDAVRVLWARLGGAVQVEFTGPRTIDGFRPFRFVLTCPADCLMRD